MSAAAPAAYQKTMGSASVEETAVAAALSKIFRHVTRNNHYAFLLKDHMSWLTIILITYFILSISNLVDKIFLSNIVSESIVYALWVNILSVLLIMLLVIFWFFGPAVLVDLKVIGELTLMTPWFIFISIIVGIIFTLAIYFLYSALQSGEASRIIPLIGGTMPVLILLMTFWNEPLDTKKFLAFIFLVMGSVLISLAPQQAHTVRRSKKAILLGFGASLSFAAFFVLTQYLFRNHGFLNGIVWPRLGSAFSIILLLAFPEIRRKMKSGLQTLSFQVRGVWLASQGLGALGFLGQQYTISIPGVSVALISALQGIQYVFILVLTTILSFAHPQLLKEYISAHVIIQKIFAVVCIGIGMYFIAL